MLLFTHSLLDPTESPTPRAFRKVLKRRGRSVKELQPKDLHKSSILQLMSLLRKGSRRHRTDGIRKSKHKRSTNACEAGTLHKHLDDKRNPAKRLKKHSKDTSTSTSSAKATYRPRLEEIEDEEFVTYRNNLQQYIYNKC